MDSYQHFVIGKEISDHPCSVPTNWIILRDPGVSNVPGKVTGNRCPKCVGRSAIAIELISHLLAANEDLAGYICAL